MKIAVVQHRLRETPAQDARALVEAAGMAAAQGAELVILPECLALHDRDSADRALFKELLAGVSAFCLMPDVGLERAGSGFVAELPRGAGLPRKIGNAALLVGDGCITAEDLAGVAAQRPEFAILAPRSENDLQAEATLELALGLSLSLAGLVIIAECAGAEPGEPGHGGSAIILLGELIAEALDGDDLLFAEIPLPVVQPEPYEALPEVSPILIQRLAHHHGEKVPQPYPADLS